MMTTVPEPGKVLALTFDACGGPGGSGYDGGLIDTLRRHSVPATLFLNARWIAANRPIAADLVADPLFEIGNHGTRHRPLSTSGRSAYGIPGTRNAGEVFDEVAGNQAELTTLLGAPPRYFRAGTAYCDDIAVRIVADLGETVVAFATNGDGGATFTPAEVTRALLTARPGAIVIGHMNHPGHGTARGVAAALPRLLDAGFRFTRLPARV
jgi:peptidoglycan/xylan/chitin deacetylase (PgdA/CDA1 family)